MLHLIKINTFDYSSPKKNIFHRVELVMYKYSNHLLPECRAQLYLRNDSIHEHNTRGSQLLAQKPSVA